MLSQLLRAAARFQPAIVKPLFNLGKAAAHDQPTLVQPWFAQPLANQKRQMSHLIPPSQYDMPWPNKLKFIYAVINYWEVIPLFTCTAFSIFIVFAIIVNNINNKCDVVFTTHNRENISRTMDLRNPRALKVIIINQRYEPWPEMQDVLDKMNSAEKRALMRAQSCNAP